MLVTGATGFVGSAVARQLIARGDSVRVLARPASDRSNLAGLDAEVVVGDLREEASLRKACLGMDGLFHVAADYRLWTRDPRELYASNVEGTSNLLRAAAACGIERIVYTSSVATLGLDPSGVPATEDTPVSVEDMIGHYKRSKFLAERAVARLIEETGLQVVIVNPSTPIGPYDVKPTPTGRVIRDALRGRIPAYVDTGLNVVHVDDVATGHLLAFQHGRVGRRYILGGEDMSLRDILTAIATLSGGRPPRIELPRPLLYPVAYVAEAWAWLTRGTEPQITVDGLRMSRKRMYFSSARAFEELGYRPRPALTALKDAVEWFRAR
jgi:dihydroflavonol-4-reductase